MPAPTNLSAATATVIASLPADISQTVDDAGTTHTVWYAYTATDEDGVIGVWAFGDLVTYRPTTTVWLGPVGAPVAYLDGFTALNVPIQVPVTSGTTYYVKIAPNAGHPTPAALTLSLLRAPNDPAVLGDLIINDDRIGYPLVILNAADGTVRQFRTFATGETGHGLPTGIAAWQDRTDFTVKIYDAALSLVATSPWTYAGGDPPISSNRVDRFYVASRTSATVSTLDLTGAVGATTWTVPEAALEAIAVNLAETVLYYYGPNDSGTSDVRRWDLVTNLPLTPLAASEPTYTGTRTILVLADDTVLVGYRWGPTDDSFIRHYSPAGTLLHTYPLGSDVQLNKMSHALEDPTSFWAWSFLTAATPGVSRFARIQISDGVVLTTFDLPQFRRGVYHMPATATPLARFGHSDSCPLIVLAGALPPGGGGGGGGEPPYVAPSYHLDARAIRRLRRAPHVANEHSRVFYRRFELDLERGQALATGQGSDPQVLLRISRDGGQTWGEEQRMAAGRLGEYQQRVIARRLGQARDTVFEVVVSDPVAWSLVGAWLDLEAGTS